jgi:hypothetical protein
MGRAMRALGRAHPGPFWTGGFPPQNKESAHVRLEICSRLTAFHHATPHAFSTCGTKDGTHEP